MSAPINQLMFDEGPAIYYQEELRHVLEDHLEYFKRQAGDNVIVIEDHVAHKYEGDFYGVLHHYRIYPYLHWITMRMSGLTNPSTYRGQIEYIVLPPENEIKKVVRQFRTARNK